MDSVRTCLACRHKGDRSSLLRFVRANDGEICFDEKASLPHRGAWLCPKDSCLNKAFEKRLLFRKELTLPIDGEIMKEGIALQIKKSILNRLGLLRRMGQCETGRDASIRFVNEGHSRVIVLACDFAARSSAEIKHRLEGQAVNFLMSSLTMDEVGKCLGRRKTGVVALLKSRITDEIVLSLNKLSALGF